MMYTRPIMHISRRAPYFFWAWGGCPASPPKDRPCPAHCPTATLLLKITASAKVIWLKTKPTDSLIWPLKKGLECTVNLPRHHGLPHGPSSPDVYLLASSCQCLQEEARPSRGRTRMVRQFCMFLPLCHCRMRPVCSHRCGHLHVHRITNEVKWLFGFL
jgi:hypothetical protein